MNDKQPGDKTPREKFLANLATPWTSGGLWLMLQLIVIWTVLFVVLLNANLGKDEARAQPWLWGLMLVPWFVFVASYLMASFAPKPPAEAPYNVDYEVFRQCAAMANFALPRAKTPETSDLKCIQELSTADWNSTDPERVKRLRPAHERLSKLVAPAIPQTLVTMSRLDAPAEDSASSWRPTPRHDGFAWLGTFRLARMMLGLSLALLPVFVTLAMTKGTSIDSTTQLFSGGFIDRTLTAAYLVSASALGACFAALFKVRKYVENLSYDSQYESSYWVRFVLGVMAGLVLSVSLSNLLPTPDDSEQFQISVPVLALIGGFSSDLVYRILKRLLDAVETLIQGSASEINEAERIKSEARLQELTTDTEQKANQKVLEAESREISTILDLMTKIPDDATGAFAREKLSERLGDVVRSRSTHGESATTPAMFHVTPARLEFVIADGAVPGSQVVTFTNVGAQPLQVTETAVHLAKDAVSPFEFTAPDTVEPGTAAQVTVSVKTEAVDSVTAQGLRDELQIEFGGVRAQVELVAKISPEPLTDPPVQPADP